MSTNTRRTLGRNAPRLFSSRTQRGAREEQSSGVKIFQLQDGSLTNDTSLGVSSSYKYNPQGTGLVSTQQLNVDWEHFENHTFFNSAQVKTNVAFQKIYDEYPFDGSRAKVETFLSSLTGFEKWVFDEIPKETNYLFFSGSTQPQDGTVVIVKDAAGAQFGEASTNKTGASFLSPGNDSLTFETHLFVASGSEVQTVFSNFYEQGLERFGYGSYISGSTITFQVASGSTVEEVSSSFTREEWSHYAFVYDRNPYINKLFIYQNGEMAASSSGIIEFGSIDCRGNDFIIGSGSMGDSSDAKATLSGALDEFRFWNVARTQDQIVDNMYRNVFADDGLLLYFKFNEPNTVESPIVIDSSKNSLHGRLSAQSMIIGVRSNPIFGTLAGDNPMRYEELRYNPVLFPHYNKNVALHTQLITSASNYDDKNPNLITKLIPRHYLIEGQLEFNSSSTDGLISGQDPRTSKLGGTQALLMLLYTWAKFFDEMKLYTQSFADMEFVDYDMTGTVPDEFLKVLAEKNGIELPPLFQGSSIEQFIEGQSVEDIDGPNTVPLQQVQNLIWRRILINMRDFITSKGTLHSVKSFIRSIGIDPDNNFRIREFGGPTEASLEHARDKRSEVMGALDFSLGNGSFVSPFLIADNHDEPGWPDISGQPGDVLLTSGSWTYEAIYKMQPIRNREELPAPVTQSLIQLSTTNGAQPDDSPKALLVNVHAISDRRIELNGILSGLSTANLINLHLDGPDIYDGGHWNVSFGVRRNDDELCGNSLNSVVSSSIFIRASKQENGEIVESYESSTFFMADSGGGSNEKLGILAEITSANPNGLYFRIGETSYDAGAGFLSDTSLPGAPLYSETSFNGRVSQVRFWSKFITPEEWKEHVRNPRSVGAFDPKTNWNFNGSDEGSWNRLRLDLSLDQPETITDSVGELYVVDYSQGYNDASNRAIIKDFPVSTEVIKPQKFFYSYISPKYDSASSVNKVRARGYEDLEASAMNAPWAVQGPVNEVPINETPTDNEKFSIEFSVVDALDQDIMTIFGTLAELDNALGDPNLLFSQDYPSLEVLRRIYFNKLTDKMNLKGFFEFFKWFDTNISTFVAQLLPRKTNFRGTNFVIESHAIERAKVEYKFEDQYLSDVDRSSYKTILLMRAISGGFNRY